MTVCLLANITGPVLVPVVHQPHVPPDGVENK